MPLGFGGYSKEGEIGPHELSLFMRVVIVISLLELH